MIGSIIKIREILQGEYSGCSLGVVDIKTKVVFQQEDHIIKRNLCFDVNKTQGTTWWVTL